MEVLSEHLCQGWLEGYLLTGRHGLFSCYEAFIHIVDSMFNQHAKWLKVSRQIPWRRPVASLNYLLTSHVWRQDHNGFSHQDPGFIDHVVNKKAEIVRVYLPPDANCLLSVADHCLRSRDYVNLIVAGKQPELTYLTMEEAVAHCTRGIGIWEWASNEDGVGEPDVVMACCGDVPTLETRRGDRAAAREPAGPQSAGRQRSRPDAAGARPRAPARALRPRVRLAVHARPAGDLRLPRLPGADPPPHLQALKPRQHACARLPRGGHDDDSLRHGDAERTSTASIWRWTRSTRCRAWALGQPSSARRWPTAGLPAAPSRESTARIIRKCASGSGRGEPGARLECQPPPGQPEAGGTGELPRTGWR